MDLDPIRLDLIDLDRIDLDPMDLNCIDLDSVSTGSGDSGLATMSGVKKAHRTAGSFLTHFFSNSFHF